jgi:hypothetical protein
MSSPRATRSSFAVSRSSAACDSSLLAPPPASAERERPAADAEQAEDGQAAEAAGARALRGDASAVRGGGAQAGEELVHDGERALLPARLHGVRRDPRDLAAVERRARGRPGAEGAVADRGVDPGPAHGLHDRLERRALVAAGLVELRLVEEDDEDRAGVGPVDARAHLVGL